MKGEPLMRDDDELEDNFPMKDAYYKQMELLPQLLAPAFVNAMEKYRKDSLNEKICCILNIDRKAKVSFFYGDNENMDKGTPFYEHFDEVLSETLKGTKILMEVITRNWTKHFARCLQIAAKLAEEQKAFDNISITIYGKLIIYGHEKRYGPYNIDIVEVIYKKQEIFSV